MKIQEKIKEDLKQILDEKRYTHTMGVVKSALELCKLYDCDKEKAEIASLLHDIAKQMNKEKVQELIEKYDIQLDETEKEKMQLMHSKIGECIAKNEYDVSDEDILNAISYHTTGRKNMSKLEMVVCLADYIEENRKFDGVDEIRRLSKIDLKYALYYALNGTMIDLLNKNEKIHKNTLKARNDLLNKAKKYIE